MALQIGFASYQDARNALEVYKEHRGKLLFFDAVLLKQYNSLHDQEKSEEAKKPIYTMLDLKTSYYHRRKRIPFVKLKVKQSSYVHRHGSFIDTTKTVGQIPGFPLGSQIHVGPFINRNDFLQEKCQHHFRLADLHSNLDDVGDQLFGVIGEIEDFNIAISRIISELYLLAASQEENEEAFELRDEEMNNNFWRF